ncbi:MAG: hypothetical protein Q8M29_01500 [Bacteroidota bacterium]|nr:hypothetical protein [Bacteroidota bacterium]
MQTENIFIAHPTTTDQLNALKAVVKAMKVKFELKKENPYDISDEDKALVLGRIKSDKDEDLLDWNTAKKQLKRK